ncbi:GGDEF domain-containing protein [Vibrio aquaticus]|uniref:diguanylate cyclase n=1 Tax=Vibrio aquaticus TaxID=2496559 RepID=A0A3S0Q0K4_9VIBR|nr:GGDEF domain-containing protein [Vibrio aquaticus]RTZ14690.1 GGDEF domain-containing protein [Vibrio aquaticus]
MVDMQREEWLSLLLKELPERLIVIDHQGLIVDVFSDADQTGIPYPLDKSQAFYEQAPNAIAAQLKDGFEFALSHGNRCSSRYSLSPSQLLQLSIEALQEWGEVEERWFEATFKPLTLSNGQRYILWQEKEITQAHQQEVELKRQAETDELTGVLNRRAFTQGLEQAFNHPVQPVLSCLMIDIDHFKEINDQVGHLSGDEVITQVAQICQGLIRSSDYIGRLGGEEFGVVLSHTNAIQAYDIAERIRQSIETTPCRVDNHIIYPTVSIGIAELNRQVSSTRELLVQADKAMYYSKQTGRNQVTIFYDNLPDIQTNTELKATILKAS